MSRFCVNCGTELPDEAGFCPKCGTKIEVPCCPACGKEVDYESDFCIYCGQPLKESKNEETTGPVRTGLKSKSESACSPPGGQAAKEPATVDPDDGVMSEAGPQEFSWSYKAALGRLETTVNTVTVQLTNDVIHILETQGSVWGNKEPNQLPGKEISLSSIESVRVRPHWSVLFGLPLLLCIPLLLYGWLASRIDWITAVFCLVLVAVVAIRYSFQIHHQRMIIIDRDKNKVVLRGKDRSVLQQVEEAIVNRTGLMPSAQEKKHQALKIIGIILVLLVLIFAVICGFEEIYLRRMFPNQIMLNPDVIAYARTEINYHLAPENYDITVEITGGNLGKRTSLPKYENAVFTYLFVDYVYDITVSDGAESASGTVTVDASFEVDPFDSEPNDILLNTFTYSDNLLGFIKTVRSHSPIDTEAPTAPEIRYESYIVDENNCLDIESWTEICVNIRYWDEKYDSTIAFLISDLPDYAALESETTAYHELLGLTARDAVLGFTTDGQHICFHRGNQFPVGLEKIPYDIVDVFRILGNESDTVQEFAMWTMHYMNMLYSESASTDPSYDAATAVCLQDRGYYSFKHILLSTNALDGQKPLPANEKTAVLQRTIDLREQLRDAGDSEALFDQLMNQYSQDGRDENGNLYSPNGYLAGKGEMVIEVEEGARALWIGEISEPVESAYGYHIILRTEPDWASIIAEIRAQLYAVNSQSGTASESAFDDIVGTWQDREGYGAYLFIGYGDTSRQSAYAYFMAAEEFEVELFAGEDGESFSGTVMRYGSEPVYAIEIFRYKYWLEVSIYIPDSEDDITYIRFVPADPDTCPYNNPYYTD